MTAFDKPFLFFDNPRGGTDQLDKAKAAGYLGGFGNVVDYPSEAWDQHRASAKAQGMFFGPWGRTGHPPPQGTGFEIGTASKIRMVAKTWDNAPYILNCEKEIDNSGAQITGLIKTLTTGDDCALSCEAWPFGNVDWTPVGHLPVLPQIFPQDWGWPQASTTREAVASRAQTILGEWHRRGVKCVFHTYGAYGGWKPEQFPLQAPFSLYTADAIGIQNYGLWKPTSSGFVGCVGSPKPPPSPVSTAGTRSGMTTLARTWEAANGGAGSKPLTRITIARRIVEDFYTNEQWARMAPTIKAVLDQEQDEG